ncbi:MAG: hypothetical protein HRJ53_06770 [Acidobacteria bacterium Pan2503]|uniref:Uncharacterized protein n=1 Tax=Candidatus Acidiferrum panamense TaxID=2741543 RepID=A0A7V8NNN1_9BACT|nr:hypothetical protein [Candidatus Acidoferrum panamensis]
MESKNDVITYEGLASICKGMKVTPSTMICALWERGFLDLDTKKFAVAE